MVSSCHDAKFHLDKFYKKGGVITCDTIYVKKTDTLTIKGVDGKDSLIYITTTVPCNCPKATVKTRWSVRFDNKRFKDSLKIISGMYSDSLDAVIKNNKIDSKVEKVISKQENKKQPWWITFLSVMGAIFIIIILTKILIKYIKTNSLQ
jgi:late competence protein required for DNA uptake (superfamily II DNA/RNA helicase)